MSTSLFRSDTPTRRAAIGTASALDMSAIAILVLWVVCLSGNVAAFCECGYTTLTNVSNVPFVFTDLIESDFVHIVDIARDTDWSPQNFSVTAKQSRGVYGTNFSTLNIFSDSVNDKFNWSGPGKLGGDPGVNLVVRGGIPANGYVPVAQMDSERQDLLWGSYRASMKLSPVKGTCAAFFWYFNDSQEIDMEFLSKDFDHDNNSYPVNLVLQSPQSAAQGFNDQGTGNYKIEYLPFDPTTGFHEYRIDFLPGNVIFYADGNILTTMNTSAVPTSPGHMILTQWSNGNVLWSSGPPVQDAAMVVSYVKAYFNSSTPGRLGAHQTRCKDPIAPGALCAIPDHPSSLPGAVDNLTNSASFFFTDEPGMADDQIHSNKNDGSLGGLSLFFVLLSSFAIMLVAY